MIETLYTTPKQFFKIFSAHDPGGSIGSNVIHHRGLRGLAYELSFPLAILFNDSLNTCVLSEAGHSFMVVPILKKSFRFRQLNYRPISPWRDRWRDLLSHTLWITLTLTICCLLSNMG